MDTLRVKIAVFGILLPYVARVPGTLWIGWSWIGQYLSAGVSGFLFIEGANAVSWGMLIAITFLTDKRYLFFPPILTVFLFTGLAHAGVDLASNSTAAVALFFIPFWSVGVAAITLALAQGVAAVNRRAG